VGLFSRKPKKPNKNKPADLGADWADTDGAQQVLKNGRKRPPSYRWRCCRCGAGFVLPIEPEKVPVPWWYGEAITAAGWENTNANPVPWSCPGCGTYAYTVPL
jgi:rubrerythrin